MDREDRAMQPEVNYRIPRMKIKMDRKTVKRVSAAKKGAQQKGHKELAKAIKKARARVDWLELSASTKVALTKDEAKKEAEQMASKTYTSGTGFGMLAGGVLFGPAGALVGGVLNTQQHQTPGITPSEQYHYIQDKATGRANQLEAERDEAFKDLMALVEQAEALPEPWQVYGLPGPGQQPQQPVYQPQQPVYQYQPQQPVYQYQPQQPVYQQPVYQYQPQQPVYQQPVYQYQPQQQQVYGG